MNWPRLGTKTRMIPATTPGMVSGTVTRQKADRRGAPRSAEASSSERSSFSSEA